MFLTVTVCAALVVPTAWLPKDRLAGLADNVAVGVVPPEP